MDTPSAIITGAASGIGKEIAAQLASCGCQLTLLDVDRSALLFTSQELSRRYPAVSIRSETLDVTQAAAQRAAFRAHVETYGGLQLVVLNAGIGERGPFFDPANEGWQNTLDVDLTAVLHGIKIAAEMMSGGGAILAVASAGAFFPMPVAPVYAAAKAGVAHFVRSSARSLASRRPPLRLMALCPEFVETPLVTRLMKEDPELARQLLGSLDIKLLSPAFVASVAADMLADNSGAKYKPGAVALIRQDGEVVQPHARNGGKVIGGSGGKHRAGALGGDGDRAAAIQAQRRVLAVWAVRGLPLEYKKAARLVTVPLGPLLRPPRGQLLVRRVYAGINASDINYSSGRYHASRAEAESKLPFDAGFESVNVVVAVGEDVQGFAPGDCMAALSYGSFSEYGLEPARTALPVPRVAPEVVALLTSGLTASIALEEAGRIREREVVLVTAAAGGTGQFAVQLAKATGCKVVATCGGPDKARLLQELGADRVIDYTKETVKAVLKREFPKGVDVVYESVGGDMFNTAVDALGPRGRLVIIGMMSSYGSGWAPGSYPGLAEKLLWKSAAAVGFFLLRYAPLFKQHLSRLVGMWEAGQLRVAIDPRVFVGVESVFDAVDHLHSGRSMGKVVVRLSERLPTLPVAAPVAKL